MQTHIMKLSLWGLLVGCNLLYTSSIYAQTRPGISGEPRESPSSRYQSTRQKKMAYMNERDRDIHHRANRLGDWGYKQNYRYDREAFYRGETQGEAYDLENPDSAGGIGMDPDVEYLEMRKFYMQDEKRSRQNAQNSNNKSEKSTPQNGKPQQYDNRRNSYPANYYSRPPSQHECYYDYEQPVCQHCYQPHY